MSADTVSIFSDTDSIFSSSQATFNEKDFQLPELEINNYVDFASEKEAKRQQRELHTLISEIKTEKKLLKDVDHLAQLPDENFSRKKGVVDRFNILKARRGKTTAQTEIHLMENVMKRKPGNLKEKADILQSIARGTFEGDAEEFISPTIDHPKLGSVEEKLEDIRQESIEHWCAKHGTAPKERYTNKEKRMLRKWFQALDYDGSGEVNVEELQDPMLSSGILKTREQVVRVLANVDKNNTMGIDFEEFLLALSGNKLADQRKLRQLQQMSADPYFETDTLITGERRNKLIKSILRRCEERQKAIERLYKKYDKPKLTKKEREQFSLERERLEEEQSRSVYLHLKYVHALEGVIEDKKDFYDEQARNRNAELEDRMNRLSAREFYKTISDVRQNASSRKEAIEKLQETIPLSAIDNNGFQPLEERFGGIAFEDSMASSDGYLSHSMMSSQVTYKTFNTPVLSNDALNVVRPQRDTTLQELRANPYKIYQPFKSTPKKKTLKKI